MTGGTMTESRIILASASPRRIEIFRDHGVFPDVIPSGIDETLPFAMDPYDTTMYLSLKKAVDVSETAPGSMTVIAADTVVYDPPSAPGAYGEIMGKPQDENDAFRMLMSLRGRTHQVITGVCLIRPEKHIKRCFYDVTYVTFCNYPEEEIRDYLKTPEAYDKAGAYAIQEKFGKYAVDVRGSELNVIGFPWEKYCELTETMF
jgi:septum formation protein